jgi:Tfp pilus assembly protein PilN
MYLSDAFARKRELLEELGDRNRADSARVKDLRTKKERLRIIKENVQDDRGALDVLRIISEKPYIPEKVTLTSFDYKRGDYVKLTGDAKDLPSANQLVNDLRNTGFFTDATLNDVVANKPLRGRGNATVTGWTATFTFPKPVKPKPKSSSAKKSPEDEI